MMSKIRFWLALFAAASVPLGMYYSQQQRKRSGLTALREGAMDKLPDDLLESASDRVQAVGSAARERAGALGGMVVAKVRRSEPEEPTYDEGREDWRTYAQRIGR